MTVSEQTFRTLALEDPEGRWELHCGRLRQKPGMSFEHNHLEAKLFGLLFGALDEREFEVRAFGHVRHTSASYYIPDVYVVPIALVQAHRGDRALEVYDEPLPLVVEIWSPSTGDYDVRTKLAEYQRRRDQEIWLIHPYERILTSWVRQPNGDYTESRHSGGSVTPRELPDVTIDLDTLFI